MVGSSPSIDYGKIGQRDPSPCCDKPMSVFPSLKVVMCSGCKAVYKINYNTGMLICQTAAILPTKD